MEIVRDKIGKIKFRILSPETIASMSVVKVVNPELYDADGFPMDGGLMDLRMGVITPGMRCRTCGERVKECLGHFGHIQLARPVIHVKYVKWIYRLLRATCRNCGRVLVSDEDIEKAKIDVGGSKAKLLKLGKKELFKKAISQKVCPHCKAKKEPIKYEKPTTFYEGKTKLTPIDIREWFERISDEDLIIAGFNPLAGRPEWMILTLLPVPPVTVRPSITLESGTKSEDDLTHKLSDLVRANLRLAENIDAGAPEVIIDDLWELLQYHVTTLFDNEIAQLPPARHRNGRPLKTLSARIKSKEGRFRKNLAGKRVDFSARSVISPDPSLKINEVGIPFEIAKELTIPERVTEWNIKWLKKLIDNGPERYPGANYVITPEGKRKRINDETKAYILEELKEGYIVERHLIDGDPVIFNRQPSLHRISMMVHRVKVLPYRTFRFNLCVCPPYNADFDGDEMNLHVPQTEEARSEAILLMDVNKNLVSPRYGLPIIGLINDHILGAYMLTQDDTRVPREVVMDILAKSGIFVDLPNKDVFTGKEIFSMLLPRDLNFEYDAGKGNKIVIKDGQLISGVIDKKSVGAGEGKLLHKIIIDYGNEAGADFLNKASLLFINYLQYVGITVAPSDADLPKEAVKKIKEVLDFYSKKVDELVEKYRTGKIESYPGKTKKETLELKILSDLSRARNKVAHIVEEFIGSDMNNGTVLIAESGARGKLLNLSMVAACIGQMALRGRRITRGYYQRTLPHFKRGDLSAESNGFVRSGYKKGLNPFEFFFNAISSRNSLMDTSMRTPKSGYLQRRLINALQDLKVYKDLTVRDSRGVIIQFLYGEDGMDVSKTIHGGLTW